MVGVWGEIIVGLGILLLLGVSFYVGRRVGQVADHEKDNVGTIQGATLGLIGLILGFSFSGAMGRFVERQDNIVAEANALGTAWLRCDLLEPEARAALRGSLHAFAKTRATLTEALDASEEVDLIRRLNELHGQAWAHAIRGVEARPGMAMLVLAPLNDIADLLSKRNAYARRHMPGLTVILLLSSVSLGAAVMGYGLTGKGFHVRLASAAVVLLIGGLVWVTIDLDFPQRGLIRLSNQSFVDVLETMAG